MACVNIFIKSTRNYKSKLFWLFFVKIENNNKFDIIFVVIVIVVI
jgi:hypothetical protein